MEEKILNTRKNGMAMLLLTLLGYVASIALFIFPRLPGHCCHGQTGIFSYPIR